jgi:hypothetical protein
MATAELKYVLSEHENTKENTQSIPLHDIDDIIKHMQRIFFNFDGISIKHTENTLSISTSVNYLYKIQELIIEGTREEISSLIQELQEMQKNPYY